MSYHQLFFFITIVVSFLFVSADEMGSTNTLLAINNPVNNQNLIPNQQVIIQYTVNGVSGQTYPPKQITNYPNSLKMEFRWNKKNDTNGAPIQLTGLSGLSTESSAGGLKNLSYSQRWKLPNCHFFRRYMPSEWSFSLVFEPEYTELPPPPPANNNATNKHVAVAIPLGPKQSVITIPINVSFNVTRMDDAHHKGC